MEETVTLPEWLPAWYENAITWGWNIPGDWMYFVSAFRENKEIEQPYAEVNLQRVNSDTGIREVLWNEAWCRSCDDTSERALVRAEELRCLSAAKVLAMRPVSVTRFHECCEGCGNTRWIEVPLDKDLDAYDDAASLCDACRASDD